MPQNQAQDLSVPEPPPLAASAERIAQGKSHYHRLCAVCHGFNAESSLILPDLRYLTPERHAVFDDIVMRGIFEGKGMPNFSEQLAAGEAELIHGYLNGEAHKHYAARSQPADMP